MDHLKLSRRPLKTIQVESILEPHKEHDRTKLRVRGIGRRLEKRRLGGKAEYNRRARSLYKQRAPQCADPKRKNPFFPQRNPKRHAPEKRMGAGRLRSR